MCAAATMAATAGPNRGINISKRMTRLPNRTSFNISANAGKIMASSDLPRTVRLYNVIKQGDTQDTTCTVTCNLSYDSYGRLTQCIRTVDEVTLLDSTLHNVSDTVTFDYYPNGLLRTTDAHTFYASYNRLINMTEATTNLYTGSTLIGYNYNYTSSNGEWTKSSIKFEKGLYNGTDEARITTYSDTTESSDPYQTKYIFHVTGYNEADGSISGIRYIENRRNKDEARVDIRNIRWRKWSGMSWFDNISYTDAYFGVSQDTETLPLALFTKFFNTDANDVESFDAVTLYGDNNTPDDTVSVNVTHDGQSLVYSTNSDEYYGNIYRYTPLDALGSFNIHVDYNDPECEPEDYTYKGVSFLPDYMVKLSSVPVPGFDDFEIDTQGDDLITYRDDYEVMHDAQRRLVRFATKYAHAYDDDVEYQIAECSDFMTVTEVAEISTATSWTAIGGQGTISVRNAGGNSLTVYAISGRLVYATGSATDADVEAQPGIYLVKVGSKCQKVIVK